MRRVFITKHFARWMRHTTLMETALCRAVDEIVRGLVDADLGGNLYKKRVALPGMGKSSGTRTLLAIRRWDRFVFIFGFEKNERDNVADDELEELQRLASYYVDLSDAQIANLLAIKELKEICHARTDA